MTDTAQVHERYTEGPLLGGVERRLSARSGARRMRTGEGAMVSGKEFGQAGWEGQVDSRRPRLRACMLAAVASSRRHHGEASRFHDLELSWS